MIHEQPIVTLHHVGQIGLVLGEDGFETHSLEPSVSSIWLEKESSNLGRQNLPLPTLTRLVGKWRGSRNLGAAILSTRPGRPSPASGRKMHIENLGRSSSSD
jgi:hypothetical protein